ncbi:MAG: biotin--[acetyl-CoA-carboxylase] ligase [Lachnospiraceae bacterium]
MKAKILNLLRNKNDYVSGQELCKEFGVSRTAIWKAVGQLKEEGYQIEAVQNKGYKLKSYPDILSHNEIASRLLTKWVGKDLYFFETIDSTNKELRKLAEKDAKHGTIVLANHQQDGKGRRGRSWVSPAKTSISMSVLCRPNFSPNKASMLTILMAYAIAKSIKKCTGLDAQIKWPNDVLVNEKKVCGILTEMNAEVDYIHYVIIGPGINVNLEEIPEELKDIATSLFLEKGQKISRAELIEEIALEFEMCYEQFLETKTLSFLQEDYNELLISKEKVVRVLDPKGEFIGTSKGINELGELIVKKETGEQELVYAGEVSVRGIYGYAL